MDIDSNSDSTVMADNTLGNIMQELNDLKAECKKNSEVIIMLKKKVDDLEQQRRKDGVKHKVDQSTNTDGKEIAQPIATEVESLEMEIEQQVKDRGYVCDKCSYQTNEESALKKHERIAHKNGCKICEEEFNSKVELINHIKANHLETISLCKDYLNDKCINEKEECHYLHAEKEKPPSDRTCKKCDKTLESFEELSDHDKTHKSSQTGQFKCEQCENSFTSNEILQEHMILHSESEDLSPMRCTKCGQVFSTTEELKSHNKTHLKFIPCKFLPNCQYGERCYYSHEQKVENVYPCFECGEKFNGIKNLMVHRKFKHELSTCKKFLENKCAFNADTCWFKHQLANKSQDFQMDPVKLKPPIENLLNQNQQLMQTMLKAIEEMRAQIQLAK